ncbi:MAG: hypothetical protein JOZ22_24100 [Acidobacteriia bacterium]|nr:hypothetical protein [Terriglobia bacterium]
MRSRPGLFARACLICWPAVQAGFAMSEAPPEVPAHPAIAVFMDFDGKPLDLSLEEMKKEVEGLLKSSGVALSWRMLSENHGTDASPGLVVVKFRGNCRVESWPRPGEEELPQGTHTLGFTRVSGGHVLPFSEIECNQIRKSLTYLARDSTPQERQKAFGLAMGRVVAHELYHMLTRTTAHAEEGLARATQSLRDLVASPAIVFRESDARAIAQSLHAR